MSPQPTFCPNLSCPSRGVEGAGNLRVHDSLRNRWKCATCGKTFSGRQGTPFYGLKTDAQTVICILTLLAHGCPLQAIVVAFGLDARTVTAWQKRAGQHCQQVHEALVQQPKNRGHVEADQIRVRGQKRQVFWMALAVCVSTRLWLGGVVSAHRDKHLVRALAKKVRACCQEGALLVVTDGWRAYRDAFVKAFRTPVYTGKPGSPRLVSWTDFVLVQTIKCQEAGRCLGIRVCQMVGHCQQIAGLLPKGQEVCTAYIERLNATFRQRLAGLCRRTRCLLGSETSVTAGMYLVGTVYNFCTPHRSLCREGQKRTPAMAAGLTDSVWSVGQLLCFQVAPAPYVAPKRRRRPPKKTQPPVAKEPEQLVTG